ncbi:hypothetical protein BJX63DRAFT_432499 [Aspergillus granulosus]|uniref:Spindle pole body-associated protein cut12 domain-containing protein n=1 Tax=Aspergillus granulosus TaxID=176169 RepID=A0ABR4HAU9_9EURO
MACYGLGDLKGKRRVSKTSDYQSTENSDNPRPGAAINGNSHQPGSSEESGPSSSAIYGVFTSTDQYREPSYTRSTLSTCSTLSTPEGKAEANPALLGVIQHVIEDPATPTMEKASLIAQIVSTKGSERGVGDEEENWRRDEDIRRREDEVMRREEDIKANQVEAHRLSRENDHLRARLRDLRNDNQPNQGGRPANATEGNAKDQSATEREQKDKIRKLEEDEKRIRDELAEHKNRVASLNLHLDYAGNILADYRGKMVDYEQKSDEWIKSLRDYNEMLSLENINLKTQVQEIRNFVASIRQSDTSRWVKELQEAREAKERSRREGSNDRLVFGTIDREMADAFQTDTKMGDAPEPYIPPASTRMRRRLANVKPRKRAGSPEAQVARPPECRSTVSRATETYLKFGGGNKGKETSPVRPLKKSIVRTLPRKRTRLAKGADMIRRVEAVSDAERLPTPPKRIGPWYSTNPYDRRNDEELAKMMARLTMSRHSHEERGIQTEHDYEIKLVTIRDNILGYIPKNKIYTTPRYLPQQPAPLSKAQRAQWAMITDKWTLGPERAPKKQVRFAKDADYEPKPQSRASRPERKGLKASQFKLNWAHLLILILMLLLWWSNLGSPEDPKHTWKMANRKLEELAPQLRNLHGEIDSRAVRILEFEVGRFSDIDPGVIG